MSGLWTNGHHPRTALYDGQTRTAPAGGGTPSRSLTRSSDLTREGAAHMVEHPSSPDDMIRKSLLRAAKFIDEHVTQDDRLLHALEDAFASGSPAKLADAALNIVHRAEAKVWGGAR